MMTLLVMVTFYNVFKKKLHHTRFPERFDNFSEQRLLKMHLSINFPKKLKQMNNSVSWKERNTIYEKL